MKIPKTCWWYSWWRIAACAGMLALIIYFLPLPSSRAANFPAIPASGRVAGWPVELPFGLQLLSYAQAATTTLELSKTGPAEASPGEQISYQLTLTNSGVVSADKVIVTDFLPATTNTPQANLQAGWLTNLAYSPNRIEWYSSDFLPTGSPMSPSSAVSFTFQVKVDSPVPNGTILTNTYTATATNAASVVVAPQLVTTVVRAPEFGALTKTVTPTTVIPGNLLTYTLMVSNTGAYTATTVIVTDTIPAHTSYFASTPTASAPNTAAGSVITWTIAQIAPSQAVSLTLQVTTDPVITNGLIIANTDYRAASSAVFTPVVGVITAPVTVVSQPALTITKHATATVIEPGDYLGYLITVTNQSTATDFGRNLEIVDYLPPEALFVSAGISGGSASIDAPTPGSTGLVTYTITSPAALNAGASLVLNVLVRAQSPLDNNTILTNTYSLTAANLAARLFGLPVTTTITSTAKISLTKVVNPATVVAGQKITYTVIVTNTGGATAYNLSFTDTLPTGFSPSVVNHTQTVTGVGLSKQPQVVTFTIVATAGVDGGDFPNIITTTVNGVEITSGPVATVTVIPQVFTVTKLAGHEPVIPGTPLTYTLLITNQTSTTQTAIITDSYPAVVTFGAATPPPDQGNNIWQLNIGPLAGATVLVTVTVNSPLTNSLVFTNQVYVDNLVAVPVVSATVANTVTSTPTLEVSKVAAPSPANAGQTLTYTIHYSNTGTTVAANVRLTDTLPVSVTFNSANPTPASTAGGVLVWNSLPNLSPAAGVQLITVTVTVTQPVISGSLLINRVDLAAGNAAASVFTLTTPINSSPEWQISKTASSSPVAVGSVLTYTITYTNVGSAAAANVIITDTLDSGVIYQGAAVGAKTWLIGPVPADGVAHSVQFTVTVAANLANNSVLSNLFEITSDETPISSSGVITTLVQAPTLAVTKQVSPTGVARAGNKIEYTIIYTNTGAIAAASVLITDTFPLSLTGVISSSSDAVFWASPAADTLVWQDTALAVGGSGVINIEGTVITAPWPSTGWPITNSVLAAASSATATNSVAVTGRPGLPAGSISVVALPSSQQVGNNVAVMAGVTDAYGNPVDDGTPITFTTSLSGSNFAAVVVNTANGQATGILSSTVAGGTVVTAATGGVSGLITGTAPVTFTAGSAVRLTLQNTSPQTAGVTFPITITAVDQFGNVATGFTQSVSISDTTGSLVGGPVTPVNGQAVVNVTVYSATAPAATTITATATGGITGTTTAVIGINLDNLRITLAADSPLQVCHTGLLTATLADVYGNPAAGLPITFTYGIYFIPPADGVQNVVTANSGGVAVLSVTRVSATGGIVGANYGAVSTSTTVGSLPADPSSTVITVTVNPGSITANGSDTALVTAQVANCAGPVTNGTVVTFTVSPVLDLILNPPLTALTSGGVASTTITAGTLTGTVTITGNASGKTATTTLTVLQPGSALLSITKTATPAAGNVLPGGTITYTVSVQNTGSLTATNVVITDVLAAAVQYVSGSGRSNGTFNHSSGQVTVLTTTLGPSKQLTATWAVTVTAATSGTVINNTANAASAVTSLITSTTITHRVITAPVTSTSVFLPIIIKNCCLANLVIQSFSVDAVGNNPPIVSVTIKNTGLAATSAGFWVDLYVNPTSEPKDLTSGDRRWQRLVGTVNRGMAWPVSELLEPGESVTLTSTSGFDANQTVWTAFPTGNYIFYVFADSYDADNNSYVEIPETNETDNQATQGPINVVGTLETAGSAATPAPPLIPRRDLGR